MAFVSNSDPITGQAAWYDVRVRISKVSTTDTRAGTSPGETARGLQTSSPQFEALKPYPGQEERKSLWAYLARGGK